jgi:hypothetical protein
MLVVVMLLAGVTAAWVMCVPPLQKRPEPQDLTIPPDAEVSEVRIRLSKHCFGWDRPIGEFVVPKEHVPVILGWLRPSEHIREPWRLECLTGGYVIIKTVDGSAIRLRFYDAGVNPAVLTADNVDQFYGPRYQGKSKYGSDRLATSRYGAIGFADAIRDAYWDFQNQGK